jgi:hypothetical protein
MILALVAPAAETEECARARALRLQRERYAADPTRKKASSRRYYATISGSAKEVERSRVRYLADPEGFKERSTKSKLLKRGLTPLDYERMLVAQNGVCAICRQRDNGKRLAVDHSHATGRVRGLLCFSCNTGIGKLGDDPARLRLAADYLEKQS